MGAIVAPATGAMPATRNVGIAAALALLGVADGATAVAGVTLGRTAGSTDAASTARRRIIVVVINGNQKGKLWLNE